MKLDFALKCHTNPY